MYLLCREFMYSISSAPALRCPGRRPVNYLPLLRTSYRICVPSTGRFHREDLGGERKTVLCLPCNAEWIQLIVTWPQPPFSADGLPQRSADLRYHPRTTEARPRLPEHSPRPQAPAPPPRTSPLPETPFLLSHNNLCVSQIPC